jgi:hypothetical protein
LNEVQTAKLKKLRWKRSSNAWLLFLVGSALLGCAEGFEIHATKRGTYLSNVSDIGSVLPVDENATLCIDGTCVPTSLVVRTATNEKVIEIRSDSKVLDREAYILDSNGLSVRDAAAEVYEPPITLLKLPSNAGDSWKWEGKLITSTHPLPATATITTSDSQVPYGAKSVSASLVTVDLEVGDVHPVQRKMSFWVTKENGIIRREFGKSIREPAR